MNGAGTAELLRRKRETHGDFVEVANLSEALKAVLRSHRNWPQLSVVRREGLAMIAIKMARIIAGDPDHADHWHDIAGYAALGAGDGPREDAT